MNLTVKSQQHMEAIAKALNAVKAGTGDTYKDGYMVRRLTEQAAVKALRESKGYD